MFDSHVHLPLFPPEDRAFVLERAWTAGVMAVMNISMDALSLQESLALRDEKVTIYHAAATPPHDAPEEDVFFSVVQEAVRKKNLSAIGETGLDYFHTRAPKQRQLETFLRYAELAKEGGLPLIVHCREAFQDFLPLLRSQKLTCGVVHCFTGTVQDAKELLDLGWYVSVSGIVTYPRSEELRRSISYIPLERLCVETDSPYLPPQPYRGKRNEPAYVVETIRVVAEIKNLALEEVTKVTAQNAYNLFGSSPA